MIYTKTGDKGQTSLVGGERVPKFHERVEAYGNADELNSYIGLLRDIVSEKTLKEGLTNIQQVLFLIQTELATSNQEILAKLQVVNEEHIKILEKRIDEFMNELPKLHSFVLPGGSIASSHCQIARCVCRRVERSVVELSQSETVNKYILQYLNRLSDYLFVLARKILQIEGKPELLKEDNFFK